MTASQAAFSATIATMQGTSDAMAAAVAALTERLRDAREPYELLSATPDEVRLRFVGPFEGIPVVWEARVRRVGAGQPRYIAVGDWTETKGARPAARVSAGDTRRADAIALEVGLDVPVLDPPTLRKTVMMVRQWKRLRAGRHEFG